jgi:hypothetical protein
VARAVTAGRFRLLRSALVLAAAVCAAARPAAAQAVTATSGSPAAIARIRALYAEIEREAPGYRQTTHDVWGFSLEGGELKGFYRGGELRKLSAHLYGETWQGTEDHYFSGGRLVFIHVVHGRYDEPMSGRVRVRIEHRYYFDGARLVRYVRTQHPRSAGDMSIFDPDFEQLLEHARLFAACAAATGSEPPECTAPGS